MPKLMPCDPLDETDRILRDQFYGGGPLAASKLARVPAKPTHYKIVCISLYNEDIARLEEKVTELKRRGYSKANKSALIRFALDTVDLDKMPRGY